MMKTKTTRETLNAMNLQAIANNMFVNDVCLGLNYNMYMFNSTSSKRRKMKAKGHIEYQYYRLLGFLRRNPRYQLDYQQRLIYMRAKQIVRSSYHEDI